MTQIVLLRLPSRYMAETASEQEKEVFATTNAASKRFKKALVAV